MAIDLKTICRYSADALLFLGLQAALILFVFVAALRAWIENKRRGIKLSVKRGKTSMRVFYATYAAINSFLVTIILAADIAEGYRVLWLLLDAALVAYVCLLNSWFRNRLLGWAEALTEIENK